MKTTNKHYKTKKNIKINFASDKKQVLQATKNKSCEQENKKTKVL